MNDYPEELWLRSTDSGRWYKDKHEQPDPRWPGQRYVREDLASQWQPMETAPKDGTCILIALDGDVYPGLWLTEDEAGDMAGWNAGYCTLSDMCYPLEEIGVPVAWQPLPALPTRAEDGL